MNKIWITASALAALAAAGAAIAQTQDETPRTDTAQSGEEMQQRLEARAVRIPASELAAALRAAEDGRGDRAQTVRRGPDISALIDEIKQTEVEDARSEVSSVARSQQLPSVAVLPRVTQDVAVRPGLRAMRAEQLERVERAEVEIVNVPVLIPAHPDVRHKLKVYGMENVYTAAGSLDADALLTMTGTCNRVVGGDPRVVAFRQRIAINPRRLPGTGASYEISRNDFGVDLSFSKFGCGYVINIECGDPAADPRCADDDYVIGLADSLLLANPELAGGE